MTDPRELGCYIGVVPHHCQSGTSIDKPVRTSRYRDRGANAALTSCATVAIRFNPAIQTYYRRLIARGVHPNKAKNNCKFKIINILLSMLKTRTKFDMEKYGKSVAQWGNASAWNSLLQGEAPAARGGRAHRWATPRIDHVFWSFFRIKNVKIFAQYYRKRWNYKFSCRQKIY